MIIKLQDLERKILTLKELGLSRQEVLKRTRSYVSKCVDISTFQELKEIVFKHIPKKVFATAPRKLYEWTEERKDGTIIVHNSYWKNLPRTNEIKVYNPLKKNHTPKKTIIKNPIVAITGSRAERVKTRGNVVRLYSQDRPTHRNKGYQSVGKDVVKLGKVLYYQDIDSKKVSKIQIPEGMGPFIYARIKLKSTGGGFVTKKVYKDQFKTKPITIIKKIKLWASNIIVPEKEFIKGKGNILTEKGKLEKEHLHTRFTIVGKDKKTRYAKRPQRITLTETINRPFTGEKSRYIEPPKPNLNKKQARMADKMTKINEAPHKLELSRAVSRKKRAKLTKNTVVNKIKARLKFIESLGVITTRSRVDSKTKEAQLIALKKRRTDKQVVKPRIDKETNISTYKLERQAKIKLAFQKRTETLRKYKLKKRFSKLRAYYKYKKEHDTKRKE